MTIIHGLKILHHGNCLAAIVVIADGLDAKIVRYSGDDNRCDEAEAYRITASIINALVNNYEIDVHDVEQQLWFKASGDRARWVTT